MTAPFASIIATPRLIASLSLMVVAGTYLLFRGLNLLARMLRHNAPARNISAALPGRAEVSGVATGPNTVSAPITGKACYLYRTTAWQQRKAASHEWEKIADEALHVPFFLDDSTGQLLVEPMGADLDLQSEFHKEYDPSLFLEQNKVPPAVSLFLANHGVVPARRIRIEECCIGPESVVFVAGTVTQNPGLDVRPVSPTAKSEGGSARFADNSHPRDTHAPELVRLSASAGSLTKEAMTQQSRVSAALIKAGIRNPDAWAAAGVPYPQTGSECDTKGREASRPRLSERRETPPPENESERGLRTALVIMKGAADASFLISWRSYREQGRAGVWRSALMLCGGTTLTLAGLFALLLKMRLL